MKETKFIWGLVYSHFACSHGAIFSFSWDIHWDSSPHQFKYFIVIDTIVFFAQNGRDPPFQRWETNCSVLLQILHRQRPWPLPLVTTSAISSITNISCTTRIMKSTTSCSPIPLNGVYMVTKINPMGLRKSIDERLASVTRSLGHASSPSSFARTHVIISQHFDL